MYINLSWIFYLDFFYNAWVHWNQMWGSLYWNFSFSWCRHFQTRPIKSYWISIGKTSKEHKLCFHKLFSLINFNSIVIVDLLLINCTAILKSVLFVFVLFFFRSSKVLQIYSTIVKSLLKLKSFSRWT